MTTTPDTRTVKLDVASRLDMLEVVQTVLAQVSALVGFDEDAAHYLSVAVRGSVVNAMKHGNKLDEAKRGEVSFTMRARELEGMIRDRRGRRDPDARPGPPAPQDPPQ